jgi:hypothetical protein
MYLRRRAASRAQHARPLARPRTSASTRAIGSAHTRANVRATRTRLGVRARLLDWLRRANDISVAALKMAASA